MSSSKMIASLLVATIVGPAIAAPPAIMVNRDVPELIPGPGLPSLASLNLTTEYFQGQSELRTRELLTRQSFLSCGPFDNNYANVDDMLVCYRFLNGLGDTRCSTQGNGGTTQYAAYRSARALGQSGGAATSSSCRDVAAAVLLVIDRCTRPDRTVAGIAYARSNPNLAVLARNVFT